ncbi:CHAT domain-containing protein [Microcoleus sp. bin38.metabat.b11b12b14.051]|uniref:CHAT domain-containing protein n=1 Tax=Microcoleus sp. bin38.metabat.b11b12b14.051 TaxID=2742709 RepID=UPI0025D3FFF0|nr:CHAT domain-containing protein [Microcoleus sp. bin38.metabat.b11b12b14.051]
MNEARREAYQNLIESLLTCPTEERIEILQANLELIDDSFAQFLRDWATEIMPILEAEEADYFANFLYGLDITFYNLRQGSRASNLEVAIACMEIGLTVVTREAYSEKWALFQNSLGGDYQYRIRGEKADNLEKAIAAFEASLEIYTRDTFPFEWATCQNNLGLAYQNRIRGEKADNLEKAIAACEASLEIYTRDAFPEDWARSQNNLGMAYHNRIRGEKAYNLELAMAAFKASLEIYTRDAFPEDWARSQNNLANAYGDRIRGEKADNLELAIAAFEASLQIYTRDAFPEDWARSQNNLGMAYLYRIRGEKADNLELAIAAFEASLEIYTRDAFPFEWATCQNNLATAYQDRIRGEKADNLEKAIAAFEASLEIYTRDAFPFEWATCQNNLATAYQDRIRGEKADNLEKAIAAFEASLEIYTRDAFPFEWATCQNNLATAYQDRIRGEKADNLEKAITALEASLEIYTRDAFPEDWARSQNNLGLAYQYRIRGEKADNLELAIAAFEASLEIYTRDAFPFEWATCQNNLANAYKYRIRGKKANNLELAIAAYQASLEIYTRDAFPINNAHVLYSLGGAYRDNSQLPEAYNTFKSAIETVESMRRDIIVGGEADRQKLAEEWNELYQLMVEVCLQMKNSTAALEYLERSKTRNLVELFHKARSLPEKLQRISFAQIRSLLAENEAILEWYITPNGFKVFIITRNYTQPDIWQSSSQDLQELNKFQQEYIDDYIEGSDNWKNQLDNRLEKLAQILHIDEIIARLPENCQKLILVPFRYLHLFPLHALTSSRQKADKTVQTGCLLELFPGGVRYTPSCQLLQLSQRVNPTAEDSSPSKFFAIQNPTEDLDFTDIEVEAIAKSFNPATVLSRQNASKTGLMQQLASLQNADIAHFSCHGFFDFLNPEKSALILAGAKITPLNPPLLRGETREDFPLVSEEKGQETQETPPLSKGGLGGVPSENKGQETQETPPLSKGGLGGFPPKKKVKKLKKLPPLARGGLGGVPSEEKGQETPPLSKGGLGGVPSEEKGQETPPLSKGGLGGVPSEEKRYIRSRRGETFDIAECLTLTEIFDLQLSKCRLVALSACETGLTDARNTTDEYIGLPSSFFYAGATSVLSTLWAVNDVSTAILMIKFYELLGSETRPRVSVALRESQLWLRDLSVEDLLKWTAASKLLSSEHQQKIQSRYSRGYKQDYQPYHAPMYWAAFCAVGQ